MTDPAFQKLAELVRLLTEALQSEHLTDYARSRMLIALTLAGEIYTSQHVAMAKRQATQAPWPVNVPTCAEGGSCCDPHTCHARGECKFTVAPIRGQHG